MLLGVLQIFREALERGISVRVLVPGSMACNGPALGAQAGEIKIRGVVMAGGFKQFRRATQTPFNIVYEAVAPK